jgi:ABC-type Fe3+-hydroxamate transport system substrate-binding protein
MTNDEILMPKQIQMRPPARSLFRHWSFKFRRSLLIRISSLLIAAALSSCNKPTPPASQPATVTVASLVPAATDLLVGMGAKNHLVAVCNYDTDAAVAGLPRAGDYETVDWEQLRALHPSVLITQIKPSLQPAGFKSRAADLHIQPIDIQIENLADIFKAIDILGNAIDDPAVANKASDHMHARLDAVRAAVAGQAPVRTLIFTGDDADFIAAPGGYLDDLLQIAGGVNAAPPGENHWPKIDREMLLSLKPEAIIQLMPDATPQEKQKAMAIWQRYRQLPAVAAGRVYPIYEGYALHPGWHVTDLAEQMSRCLHPRKETTKSSH